MTRVSSISDAFRHDSHPPQPYCLSSASVQETHSLHSRNKSRRFSNIIPYHFNSDTVHLHSNNQRREILSKITTSPTFINNSQVFTTYLLARQDLEQPLLPQCASTTCANLHSHLWPERNPCHVPSRPIWRSISHQLHHVYSYNSHWVKEKRERV